MTDLRWLKPLDDRIEQAKAETQQLQQETARLEQECAVLRKRKGDLQRRLVASRARQIRQLRELCATAYQVVGAADGPVELLDNLSAAANGDPLPHDPMAGLPWTPGD